MNGTADNGSAGAVSSRSYRTGKGSHVRHWRSRYGKSRRVEYRTGKQGTGSVRQARLDVNRFVGYWLSSVGESSTGLERKGTLPQASRGTTALAGSVVNWRGRRDAVRLVQPCPGMQCSGIAGAVSSGESLGDRNVVE